VRHLANKIERSVRGRMMCRNGVITSCRGTSVNTVECPVSVFPRHASGLPTSFSTIGVYKQAFLPRDAMLVRYYAVVLCPFVRPSVRHQSVFLTKTVKRRITQTAPHDSPRTAAFRSQWSRQNSNGVTLNGGAKCSCSRL